MSKIVEMAREAGLGSLLGDPVFTNWNAEIERFAALVAAAERERCAKSCEELYVGGKFHPMLQRGAIRSAEAIRALGDEVSE